MERPTFTSSCYIHFKSRAKRVCNLPAILKCHTVSLSVGFKNHIKQDSLKLAFAFTSNMLLPWISWWNVSHLWWHFQMTRYSCHTPSFGWRGQLPQTCSLWTRTDFRQSISMTSVSEDISADCKPHVYVKLIAFAMRDLCRQVSIQLLLVVASTPLNNQNTLLTIFTRQVELIPPPHEIKTWLVFRQSAVSFCLLW